ncbi:MAG: bifunctional 5,10-methylenetetrahydrofolate dehydrogenase/5,10-methenyltetrahydrofolate cyclohydrolase [Nitrososphaeraceae archaeon]|jgi:methylenetetrahydrofolate dehydrogenase (NADP+) / methenyltetrahydrofolate cyclohydrolase
MIAKIIDGLSVAAGIQEQVKVQVESLARKGVKPCLCTILVGENPSSITYINKKQKAAHDVGISTKDLRFNETLSQEELLQVISGLNSDSNVHGVLVQLPLPKHIDQNVIINKLYPLKDVDGLTPFNSGMLMKGKPAITPCTPTGILELLDFYKINVVGMDVLIINRSSLVGKPLACLLLERGSTVTVCHSKSKKLEEKLNRSEMIISAVGNREHFTLSGDMVKPGAVIIDVGISRFKGKICGDVDFDSVRTKASWITPVPGGVGPMTVAILLRNTVSAAFSAVGIGNMSIYDQHSG